MTVGAKGVSRQDTSIHKSPTKWIGSAPDGSTYTHRPVRHELRRAWRSAIQFADDLELANLLGFRAVVQAMRNEIYKALLACDDEVAGGDADADAEE